jgi:hypothetical protein
MHSGFAFAGHASSSFRIEIAADGCNPHFAIATTHHTLGALPDKVLQAAPGEAADVVILSDAALATDNTAAKQWLAFIASPQGMGAFASSEFVVEPR